MILEHDKIFPDSLLRKLKFGDKSNAIVGKMVNGEEKKFYDPSIRSTIQQPIIKDETYKQIEEITNDVVGYPNKGKLNETALLTYGPGDFFSRHKDSMKGNDRVITMITLYEKSPDLEGGILYIYDENGKKLRVDLAVGDTIWFESLTHHEVTRIIKGTRKTLTFWLKPYQWD